jgi:beta-glucosidase
MYFVARQSEVCLVFVSVFLVENWDRDGGDKALRLDRDGEEMIKRVESACAGQVVVVMHIGGQVVVEDWASAFC